MSTPETNAKPETPPKTPRRKAATPRTARPRKAAASAAVVPSTAGAAPAAPASSAHRSPARPPTAWRGPATPFAPPPERNALDRRVHAAIARATSSVSPIALLLATVDWAGHLAMSPGKRMELADFGLEQSRRLLRYAQAIATSPPGSPAHECIEPPAQDRRFKAPEWHQWPFNLMHQSFLLTQEWWDAATHGVAGVSHHHEQVVAFTARQLLDMFSPGNFLPTNPVVLRQTLTSGGTNLVQGATHAVEDLGRALTGAPPAGAENFVVGRDVAVTPGQVVFRNSLIELIQYAPTTATVHPEPVLIVPAWIMKYYILDLSPHNSLIKYLVDQGHTVFCISWKNPSIEERDLDMDDYLELGFHAALEAINTIVPEQSVHATGYCLGGTLLAIAAAAMERDGDERLATMTLFTAQTDFTEPGELALFIDESEVSLLEAQMAETGFLTAGQMSGAFQILRSNDLLWSRIVGEYLMGERAPMRDLMAWNADATRMPARMHSQYLRRLFLNDDLSEGRYPVGGKPVSLSDIDVPVFCVATQTDHVAPWRSVYKLHYLTPTEITFVLTSGGHNAGIVSEPGHPRREYQIRTRPTGENYMPPEDWVRRSPQHEGSWWPAWTAWLAARSGTPSEPPTLGAPERGYPALEDAPGRYVHEK
ncbi:PHA/PHB synthase family protein [Thauera sp.]|uniref:PHA/PHB synthase family protein n=1 Tax=Thauera sp. TaxID=1905334 RepID=UPI002A36EE25|nr:alpha/beta fold hydrolase [Thauera sp.]MDX9884280.1 alpha/beta fold hydrolase [Thauera sp.]